MDCRVKPGNDMYGVQPRYYSSTCSGRRTVLPEAAARSMAMVVSRLMRACSGVVWTVGALFDYVSGHVPRAPRWLADNGLEWIFRLAIEPQRMWRRYLLGNPAFLKRVLVEARRQAD